MLEWHGSARSGLRVAAWAHQPCPTASRGTGPIVVVHGTLHYGSLSRRDCVERQGGRGKQTLTTGFEIRRSGAKGGSAMVEFLVDNAGSPHGGHEQLQPRLSSSARMDAGFRKLATLTGVTVHDSAAAYRGHQVGPPVISAPAGAAGYSCCILWKGLMMRTVCQPKSTVTALTSTPVTRPTPYTS